MGTDRNNKMAAPTAEWKHGLFGCCDMGFAKCCCNVCISASCNLGRAAEYGHDGNCFLYCLCHGCCLPCNRCNTAEKYGINEGKCMSCCMAYCCGNWEEPAGQPTQQAQQAPGKAPDATAQQA